MIGKIEGKVEQLVAPTAIIMTASGVGYEIELPLTAFCQLRLHESVSLWTHLLVREDAQLLFGFLTYQDTEVFRQLLKVNGVGAKMALAMMSTLSIVDLAQYVASGNEAALTRIPGVGKKTAQRLIIELADKLKAINISQGDGTLPNLNLPMDSGSSEAVIIAEVEAGLVALGYKDKEAQAAIKLAKAALTEPVTTQNLLKAALKNLAIN